MTVGNSRTIEPAVAPKKNIPHLESGQEFRIRIRLANFEIREDFVGIGPEEFNRLYPFCVRILDCYPGAIMIVGIKSKAE